MAKKTGKTMSETQSEITGENHVAEFDTSIEGAKEAWQTPNVIWSSEKNEDGELLHGDPPESIRVGMIAIELPDAATQLKGFYSPHAALLCQCKSGYKKLVPKG